MDFTNRELLVTEQSEKFITISMGVTIAEQKLLWRLRQLIKQQCRGTMITFEANGFALFVLSKRENIKDG